MPFGDKVNMLTLKVLVEQKHESNLFNYLDTLPKLYLKVLVATIDAQWEGMGDVGSAKYELALLPPCPTIRVLSCSN